MAKSTRVLHVDPRKIDPDQIAEAAAVLRAGGLVAFPTETVYGLGANALDAAAARGIFEAKQRPASDPLIVHIADPADIATVAEPSEIATKLAAHFWPGPLTLVLPKKSVVPGEVTAGLPAVAVRMPAHPIARALIAAAGVPVAAPSANLFSRPSPTQASHVLQDLNGRIDMLIDGGHSEVGLESTVLDLQSDPPRILRPGAVTLDQLREYLPNVVGREVIAAEGTPLAAPGTLLKHYSPRAEVLLFEGEVLRVRKVMKRAIVERMALGQSVGLLLCAEDLFALKPGPSTPTYRLGSEDYLPGIAQHLFAGLRDLDARGVDVIVARTFPGDGIAQAIRDRLLRSAEGQIVTV